MMKTTWMTLVLLMVTSLGGCSRSHSLYVPTDAIWDCESRCDLAQFYDCPGSEWIYSCVLACQGADVRYDQSLRYARQYDCEEEFHLYYDCVGSVPFSADPGMYVDPFEHRICVEPDHCAPDYQRFSNCMNGALQELEIDLYGPLGTAD